MTGRAKDLVQTYLGGTYPATREELLHRAQQEGADPSDLSLLAALPDRRFESPASVEQALHASSR